MERNPGRRQRRALEVFKARVEGGSEATIPALAQKFRVSEATISRDLKLVERLGLLDDAKHQIVSELVPAAVETYRQHLSRQDKDMARDVLHGTGLLSKNAPPVATGEAEMTLERWRATIWKTYEEPPDVIDVSASIRDEEDP